MTQKKLGRLCVSPEYFVFGIEILRAVRAKETTMTVGRDPRGRKPKGVREQITAKVPTDQKSIYENLAREAGLPLTDYIAVALAEHHGLPTPNYLSTNKDQEKLPISA